MYHVYDTSSYFPISTLVYAQVLISIRSVATQIQLTIVNLSVSDNAKQFEAMVSMKILRLIDWNAQ